MISQGRAFERRDEFPSNWNRKRVGSRVGVTKPTIASRKAKRRKRARANK